MNNFDRIYKLASVSLVIGSMAFFLALGQVVIWGFDRAAPFHVIEYDAPPTHRGDTAVIKIGVKRDLARKCSVTYSRMFIDSKGSTFDLTDGVRMLGAAALDELNRHNPDGLTLRVKIPEAAESGRAVVLTSLEYVCNPLHQVYPIPITMTNDIIVL